MTRRRRSVGTLRRSAEIAWLAPHVALGRLASNPSAARYAQFGVEKAGAFGAAWLAMWTAAARGGWELAMSSSLAMLRAGPAAGFDPARLAPAMATSAERMTAAGIAPVHRRVRANARRLRRRR